MKHIVTLLVVLLTISNLNAESVLDELKIGIVAKDLEKVKSSLSVYFEGNRNSLDTRRWIELADFLHDLRDFSSADQMYSLAALATIRNDRLSTAERKLLFDEIITKSDVNSSKADPQSYAKLIANRFVILPGRGDLFLSLSRLIVESGRAVVPSANLIKSRQSEFETFQAANDTSSVRFEPKLIESEKPLDFISSSYDAIQLMQVFKSLVGSDHGKDQIIHFTADLVINESGMIVSHKITDINLNQFTDLISRVLAKTKFTPAFYLAKPVESRLTIKLSIPISN